MRLRRALIALWIAALLAAAGQSAKTAGLVYAAHLLPAPGVPGSSEPGYGAYLHLNGPYRDEAMLYASQMHLDWVALEVPWATYAPKANTNINWSQLDPVMKIALEHQTPILISLSQPPAWALTARGPQASAVTQFVSLLIQRYPEALKAVELFPAPNTRQGWGAAPDAKAYLEVYSAVRQQLNAQKSAVLLVSGGLKPLGPGQETLGMDDLLFLQGLYQAGARDLIPVVGLRLDEIYGTPLVLPTSSEHRVLRHYEEVRQVMLKFQHPNGLIWITPICPPSGTINSSDQNNADLGTQQTEWMRQAYTQMRSQLYLGVTFFYSLNPSDSQKSSLQKALYQGNSVYHPLQVTLRDLIASNSPNSTFEKPGKPKSGLLIKKRVMTSGP